MGLIRTKLTGRLEHSRYLGRSLFLLRPLMLRGQLGACIPCKMRASKRPSAGGGYTRPCADQLCGTASILAGQSSTADAGGGLKIGSSGFRFHRGFGGGQPPTSKRAGIYRAIACYNCQCSKTKVECCLYWCYTLLVIGCQIGNLVEGEPQNVGIA